MSPLAVSYSNDVITKFHLRQSAFCIDLFDADIQIPETWLQAFLPFSSRLQSAQENLYPIY